jgi:hypothetical protein
MRWVGKILIKNLFLFKKAKVLQKKIKRNQNYSKEKLQTQTIW